MKKHIAAKVLAAASIAWVGLTINASATLLVYEGFDYEPAFADPTAGGASQGTGSDYILTGKGGTTEVGLSGAWANAANDAHNMYLVEGSMAFGDLPTTGNYIRYNSNLNLDRFHRAISADLAGSVNEIWVSFLGNKLLSTGWGAEREGIAIANEVLGSAQLNANAGGGLQGFGVGWNGGWRAYGWDGTVMVESTDSFTVDRNGSETNLLVGHIEYNVGTDGKDVFTLYHYDRAFVAGSVTVDMDNLVLIDSIEVDVDESLLDTLNVTRQVNTAFDEIRIGTTLDDVLGFIPPPTGTVITLK